MAGISYQICKSCNLEVGLSWCLETATMLRNHDGVERRELLCSECGNKSTFYKDSKFECSNCGCTELVGHNSKKCPRCKDGKMENDFINDPVF